MSLTIFKTIFGISTLCSLIYQNMKAIRGEKKSPPIHPHNKTFLSFKKGGYYRVKWKVESSFLEPIIFMDPLGVCFASSLRGINLNTILLMRLGKQTKITGLMIKLFAYVLCILCLALHEMILKTLSKLAYPAVSKLQD